MTELSRPTFSDLDREAIEKVLSENHIGRIAYSLHNLIGLEPIHYVYADGRIYGRTSPGTRLTALQHRPWVAFEVDEVEGLFAWRSVVAHGTFFQFHEDGAPQEQEAYRHALDVLRTLLPETLTSDDPVPFRNVVFGIQLHDVTGRAVAPAR